MPDNRSEKLAYMINTCALQARWHHEQYTRLEYCQRYFAYLMENERLLGDENYLENLLRNLNTATAEVCKQSQSENGCYGDEGTQDNDVKSPVRKKKKKTKKSKAKVKDLPESYYEQQETSSTEKEESESHLDLDDGFKEFLRESARFRAERGRRTSSGCICNVKTTSLYYTTEIVASLQSLS